MPPARDILEQAAAIPYRRRKGRYEVALITSARSQRWILPKGGVERGETPAESALREAEEEAGVRGWLRGKSVGRFRYRKNRGTFDVRVYLMAVTEELSRWEEDWRRLRRWVPLEKAPKRIEDKHMRRILEHARKYMRA